VSGPENGRPAVVSGGPVSGAVSVGSLSATSDSSTDTAGCQEPARLEPADLARLRKLDVDELAAERDYYADELAYFADTPREQQFALDPWRALVTAIDRELRRREPGQVAGNARIDLSDVIRAVKERVDLVQELNERGRELRKNGRGFVGLCPIHTEKTPSFHVYGDGHYKCFGCGAHGDIITLTMQLDKVPFVPALRYLANQAGVPWPAPRPHTPTAAVVPSVPRLTQTPTACPELPAWARLDPALGKGAGTWVETYLAAARCVSPMTPELFHESLALWLAAVAVARRLVLRLSHGNLYPNLFVAWLAQTTLWRKSTALDFGRGIARHIFPHLMAPQDTTPEAFLSDLAGMEPTNLDKMPDDVRAMWRAERNFAGQRGFALDELSGILATAGRDYGAGLIEAFLHFFDCDPLFVRSSRGQGRVAVRDSCLSVLGASTPAAMAEHLGVDRLWSMGWWPRFALLTPETERPEWQEATGCSIEARDAVAAPLRRLYERLPQPIWPEPPEAVGVTLGPGVFEAWAKYNRACGHELLTSDLDGRLWGTYGRLPTQALKVSMLLAALDWGTTPGPCIDLRHLARAMQIAETWRASAHRVIEVATSTEWGRFRLRVLRQLAKAGSDGATLRDVYRQMQDMRPGDIEETLQQMVTAEEVEVMPTPAGKRGQPTKRYRLVKE
jgi:hypothetical protein